MKKYIELQSGDITQQGDEWLIDGEWEPLLHFPGNVATILTSVRRPITEPRYRPFKEGDVIEEGDQYIGASGNWVEILDWYRGSLTSDMIGNTKYRKLIK